jgi:hypothetical protein
MASQDAAASELDGPPEVGLRQQRTNAAPREAIVTVDGDNEIDDNQKNTKWEEQIGSCPAYVYQYCNCGHIAIEYSYCVSIWHSRRSGLGDRRRRHCIDGDSGR